MTTNAGATWTAAQLEATSDGTAIKVFALADGRLVVAMDSDASRLFVSNTNSDWLRLAELPLEHDDSGGSRFDVAKRNRLELLRNIWGNHWRRSAPN